MQPIRRILLTVCSLLLATSLEAQVAHDGEAIVSHRGSATTITLAGKTTAGTERLAILRFGSSVAPAAGYPQYGGNTMTSIGSVVIGAQTIYAYYYINPPTTATDTVIQWAGGASSGLAFGVTSYNGVDQTTPIRTSSFNSATGSGTTPTINISSATGDMVLDAMDVLQLISSVGADQTSELESLGGSDEFGLSRQDGAASVTMSWTSGSASWVTLGFSLQAAGAGVPNPAVEC